MDIRFAEQAWNEYTYWLDNDKDIADKIRALIKEIKRDPFKVIGKPEPLKFSLKGLRSRRITSEHRLVYKISGNKDEQVCYILQCKFHYD